MSDVVMVRKGREFEAVAEATALGHRMGSWVFSAQRVRRCSCRTCGRQIWISTTELFGKPYGPALETACQPVRTGIAS